MNLTWPKFGPWDRVKCCFHDMQLHPLLQIVAFRLYTLYFELFGSGEVRCVIYIWMGTPRPYITSGCLRRCLPRPSSQNTKQPSDPDENTKTNTNTSKKTSTNTSKKTNTNTSKKDKYKYKLESPCIVRSQCHELRFSTF